MLDLEFEPTIITHGREICIVEPLIIQHGTVYRFMWKKTYLSYVSTAKFIPLIPELDFLGVKILDVAQVFSVEILRFYKIKTVFKPNQEIRLVNTQTQTSIIGNLGDDCRLGFYRKGEWFQYATELRRLKKNILQPQDDGNMNFHLNLLVAYYNNI